MLTVLSINLNLKKYCSTWAQEETAQEQFKDYLTNNLTKDNLITVNNKQGSQIRQIWRILRQNCSADSTEVTSTPEIFGNKHSFILTFFATNTIYVNC